MLATTSIKAAPPVQLSNAKVGWKKFIPKNQVMNASGMNNVVMIVNAFITSFIRLLTTDR